MLLRLTPVFLLFLLAADSSLGFRLSEETKFKDCGSTGELISAEIVPCDTKPCTLYKGEKTQVKLNFKTKKPVTSGKAVVHGVIAGVPVPFPLDEPDLCTKVKQGCPLESGTVYEYANTFPVLKSYPSLKLNVKYELKDEHDETVVCALMPVQINSH